MVNKNTAGGKSLRTGIQSIVSSFVVIVGVLQLPPVLEFLEALPIGVSNGMLVLGISALAAATAYVQNYLEERSDNV